MPTYKYEYRGAHLKVTVDNQLRASLFINGMQRAQQTAVEIPCRHKLSTTVQTDYEWHEFIEAQIVFETTEIIVTLSANKTQLGRKSFKLPASK
tara:strand:- start:379 stop:660 length:282 start_codon:yes stop_codon:yes gene_type:complete